MDLLTQALAGATAAQSVARGAQVSRAAAIGLLAGMLADADALIRSAADPLLTLEYHRQFTHSLLFVPLGALIAAAVFWPVWRRSLGFGRIYLFALLGYLPSGLLDACTSYGTQLLWPFSEVRIAWSIIAIVDPLFTASLAVSLAVGLVRASPWPARVGLGLALTYLALGVLQHERAESLARRLAAERGHAIERLEVKPSLGNLVLWRAIYLHEGRFHVDAVRVGIGKGRVYPGGSVPRFAPEQAEWLAPGSVLAQDIERFRRFSDGFLALHPWRPDVIGDVRYALLPNSVRPLWGIEFDPRHQDRHVEFRTFRELDAATRRAFMSMLRGEALGTGGSP